MSSQTEEALSISNCLEKESVLRTSRPLMWREVRLVRSTQEVWAPTTSRVVSLTLDDLDLDLQNLRAGAALDHLQIMPARLRLLVQGWTPLATGRGHFAPSLDDGFTLCAFAIGRHRRRAVGVAAFFELSH